MSQEPVRLPGSGRIENDPVFQASRRERRIRQELAVRASIALLIIGFNEVLGLGTGPGANPVIRVTAFVALLLNGPYYLAAQTGPWFRPQAYARMLIDIFLITVGLYSAGGLAAAPYLGVYTVVPVYAGIVLSSVACVVATAVATASYLSVALLQHLAWLPRTAVPAAA